MQKYWSNDSRFNSNNFGEQPIWLIMSALEQGRKQERQALYLHELPIAQLASLYANSKRDPKKSQAFKLSDFTLFTPTEQKEDVEIPAPAANAFFSLVNDRKLPGWSLAVLPIEQLKAAKDGSVVKKPRAFVGEGLLLLLPKINDDEVQFELGVFNNVHGETLVIDIDSGKTFTVFVPSSDTRWTLEGSIPLLTPDLVD